MDKNQAMTLAEQLHFRVAELAKVNTKHPSPETSAALDSLAQQQRKVYDYLLDNFAEPVRLVIVHDLQEKDLRCEINFFSAQTGRPLYGVEDVKEMAGIIVTSYEESENLQFFARQPTRFQIKFDMNTQVVIHPINGRNTVFVFYSSGKYYIINSALGLARVDFREFVVGGAVLAQD